MRNAAVTVIGLCALLVTTGASGQDSANDPPPEPEVVQLATRDGVQISAVYYGSNRGKEAIPVVMLHGFEGSSRDFADFALYLQQMPDLQCAVITPDLRGHGDSTTLVRGGREIRLNPDRFRPADFASMYEQDMEAVKRFLLSKNNAAELNIEKLCVIGAEMGALVALNWAMQDWSWPMLATGKQGQDVKALVLISPTMNFKGLRAQQALSHPDVRSEISMHILVGSHASRSVRDATQVYSRLKRYHPEPPEDRALEMDLYFDDNIYETSLQGTDLLGQELGAEERIARFIELRLEMQPYAWKSRKTGL